MKDGEVRAYISWDNMIDQCEDVTRYKSRKARVTYPKKWTSFERFLADMGPRPKGYVLTRKNSLRPYGKRNCIYAKGRIKCSELGKNCNRKKYKGEVHTIAGWARKKKISYQTLVSRFHRGWSVERALTKPIQQHRNFRFL